MLPRNLISITARNFVPLRNFSASASSAYIISPQEVKDLNKKSSIIVDCNSPALYNHGHIPDAVNWRIASFSKDPRDPIHVLKADLFSQLACEIGLSNESEVVLYDSTSSILVSRVFWMLSYYGVQTKVLNGGWNAWVRSGLSISVDPRDSEPGDSFIATPQKHLLASAEDVLRASNDLFKNKVSPDIQIVDFRTPAEFVGSDTRGAQRGGHVPGAVNVPHANLLQTDGKYKPKEEIAKVFADAGVKTDRPIIAYCMTGVRSTVGIVSYLIAGGSLKNVANYDGSMAEWLNNLDLPVMKP